jgi:hypothetical protein
LQGPVRESEPDLFHAPPLKRPVLRSFCPARGTRLTFEDDKFPDETEITTCSLDDPEYVPPRHHTYVRSRVSWVRLADGLPEYRGDRLNG